VAIAAASGIGAIWTALTGKSPKEGETPEQTHKRVAMRNVMTTALCVATVASLAMFGYARGNPEEANTIKRTASGFGIGR
jgi:hypothetical protein